MLVCCDSSATHVLWSLGWFGLLHGVVAGSLYQMSVVWCWQVVAVIPEFAPGMLAVSAANVHVIVACACASES